MVFIRLGGEKVEGFYFHNNWKVQVDYGMNMTEIPFSDYNEIDESSLPSKDVLYCRGGRSSDYFRILKLFKDGKLISEVDSNTIIFLNISPHTPSYLIHNHKLEVHQ